jgi:hypothetical protein
MFFFSPDVETPPTLAESSSGWLRTRKGESDAKDQNEAVVFPNRKTWST